MIEYLVGDATAPQGDGWKCVAHVVNTMGGWGAGFVLAVSARWPDPERGYRQWYRLRKDPLYGNFTLGNTQFVDVAPRLYVANMIAQVGYGNTGRMKHKAPVDDSKPPIRYDALEQCFTKVAKEAEKNKGSIHIPRIGCGLAGGKWEEVEPILLRVQKETPVPIFVYDLPVRTVRTE